MDLFLRSNATAHASRIKVRKMSQLGKSVLQGTVLSPIKFHLYRRFDFSIRDKRCLNRREIIWILKHVTALIKVLIQLLKPLSENVPQMMEKI